MKASRELREMEALGSRRRAGASTIYVDVSGPNYCPHCKGYLGDDREAHVRREDAEPEPSI